jgi:hypothetical protein
MICLKDWIPPPLSLLLEDNGEDNGHPVLAVGVRSSAA